MTSIITRAIAALAAFGAVVASLLLLDGSDRSLGFRLAIAVLAGMALRFVATATADANPPPPDSPFAPERKQRRRRWGWWRRPPRRTPADSLVLGSIERAGPFHIRLRPALREAADERLRAHHGVGIDDPRAAALLGPDAWDLLRPDRRGPDDRRAPGPDEATMEMVLTAIEGL